MKLRAGAIPTARRPQTRALPASNHPRVDSEGRVQATCWCETEILWIPTAWVGNRTATCGRRGCEPSAHVRPDTEQKPADTPCATPAARSTVPGDGCRTDAWTREHDRAPS